LFKLFFRLEARGVKNIPLDRNFILAPNHTSYLDGFVLILSLPFSYFRNLYLLGLRDFFAGFIRSRLAKMAHIIPIDSASYLNKALQMSAYALKKGHSLSVFPEGGRSSDGELMEFKKGVGILAVELEVPVVPVSIKGAFESLPRDRALPRPRKITVTFGRPILASDIDLSKKPPGTDEYQYIADLLREMVRNLSTGTVR
jgi:long-chain acyl-CoA synthetase